MKLNEVQARIIVVLDQLGPLKRNMYFMAYKLDISVASIYNHLRTFEEAGIVTRMKSKTRKSVYSIKDHAIVKLAYERLAEMDSGPIGLTESDKDDYDGEVLEDGIDTGRDGTTQQQEDNVENNPYQAARGREEPNQTDSF